MENSVHTDEMTDDIMRQPLRIDYSHHFDDVSSSEMVNVQQEGHGTNQLDGRGTDVNNVLRSVKMGARIRNGNERISSRVSALASP
jgi:hypothetical protein